jgi:hypothetical protein
MPKRFSVSLAAQLVDAIPQAIGMMNMGMVFTAPHDT